MADAELQARLQDHSKAFEGLMSLIPAKVYYGEDNENQWKRKKQTKEEKRAAKKAKLDPASNKSALDVQNEKKRKREEDIEDDIDLSTTGLEQPGQGLKSTKKATKKLKIDDNAETNSAKSHKKIRSEKDEEAIRKAHVEKRKLQRERKRERKAKLIAKMDAKKAEAGVAKAQKKTDVVASIPKESTSKAKLNSSNANATKKAHANPGTSNGKSAEDNESDESDDDDLDNDDDGAEKAEEEEEVDEEVNDIEEDDEDEDGEADDIGAVELAPLEFPGLVADDSMASDSSDDESHTFDNAQESSASSASSIPTDTSAPTKPINPAKESLDTKLEALPVSAQAPEKPPRLPQIDPQIARERLQARLAILRAARKADGINGQPARNRQELIEGRRKKEEDRKAHKKELRAKAKLTQDAEAEAARLRGGSGSPMWSPGNFSPREPENNFSYGRVAFDDGAEMDSSLSTVLDPRQKKGPQDVKTALEAAQHKRARINGLDVAKRADIEEKDRWLNAKKRVNGERVRDDTNLLKKTLKRKEKGKAKSEKEWNERIEGVQKGKEMRQKKREDNLSKRREEKGGKGKKKVTGGKKKGVVKKRPGFEGSFRAGGPRARA